MPAYPAMQIHPGRGLGFLTLGASLHDVLTRLKAQPRVYPVINVSYSPSDPLVHPVVLDLPQNGFRLRFDGPDQRLRLLEVLDFTKTQVSYEKTDLVKLPEKADLTGQRAPLVPHGPAFRHVYDRMFGPTFPGEYVPPPLEDLSQSGTYILSYPGIAFNFPLQDSDWSPDKDKDFVSLLSNYAANATSLGIFDGQSWQEARRDLMTKPCPNPRSLALTSRGKEFRPDEVELITICGNGKVNLDKRSSPIFQLNLGETTPQDLISELGPPDAIHRKYDRRLSIHKNQRSQKTRRTFSNNFAVNHEDTTDTDQSSIQSITDDSDDGEEIQTTGNNASPSTECFYNYFHHGFDIFISYPTSPSPAIPGTNRVEYDHQGEGNMHQLVATKILLHANVPGSYPFNRYRRSRWVMDFQDSNHDVVLNSETPFTTLSSSLQRIWRDGFANGSSKDSAQKAMVLNRDWGDSPGSSCEILGDWEENTEPRTNSPHNVIANAGPGFGNTKLYGFPGLLFEVLKNDAVSCLTVY